MPNASRASRICHPTRLAVALLFHHCCFCYCCVLFDSIKIDQLGTERICWRYHLVSGETLFQEKALPVVGKAKTQIHENSLAIVAGTLNHCTTQPRPKYAVTNNLASTLLLGQAKLHAASLRYKLSSTVPQLPHCRSLCKY